MQRSQPRPPEVHSEPAGSPRSCCLFLCSWCRGWMLQLWDSEDQHQQQLQQLQPGGCHYHLLRTIQIFCCSVAQEVRLQKYFTLKLLKNISYSNCLNIFHIQIVQKYFTSNLMILTSLLVQGVWSCHPGFSLDSNNNDEEAESDFHFEYFCFNISTGYNKLGSTDEKLLRWPNKPAVFYYSLCWENQEVRSCWWRLKTINNASLSLTFCYGLGIHGAEDCFVWNFCSWFWSFVS